MSDSVLGLRERKKQATRVALSKAALRLCVERGVDNVTVEDIAAAVEVSTRTFFNYFSSKEEAVMSDSEQRIDQMIAALLARPADEPILLAVRNAVVGVLGEVSQPSRAWAEQVRLVKTTPSLLPQHMAAHAKIERALVAAIAQRTGTDPARDMYPALVAATASGVVRVAAEWWMEQRSTRSLSDLIADAIDQLAAGLPK